jgi:CubicO group peptidase (beta-lactamase class C family)
VDSVTVRMLLSHTGGFQNPTWPYTRGRPWEPFEPTRWDQLVAMMPYQEVAFRPGSRWSYSNPAFIYLARIIEAITGDPYQSYIQKNIWTPLGMTHSYFGATPYHLAEQRSNNYTLEKDSSGEHIVANGRDFDPGITIPNGGWNAPLQDLATWMAFLTRATHGDSATARRFDTVLRHESVEEMWRPAVVVDPAQPDEQFGLSFFVYQVKGVALVGHTGEQAGFRSFLFLDPRTGDGVIGALNTTDDAHPREAAEGWRVLVRAAHAMLAEGR